MTLLLLLLKGKISMFITFFFVPSIVMCGRNLRLNVFFYEVRRILGGYDNAPTCNIPKLDFFPFEEFAIRKS